MSNGTPTLQWVDGKLRLIDQTKLPGEFEFFDAETVEECWDAIKRLVVRGAPAIGAAAAYGVLLGLQNREEDSPSVFVERVNDTCDYLATSRPTAVNLFWALDRMRTATKRTGGASVEEIYGVLLAEAQLIEKEDKESCRLIGKYGGELLDDGASVLTHCNAGALATVDYGTALAVIYGAVDAGKEISVFADETRPLLQGARLTSWELMERGVPVTLITDNMAATVMAEGKVDYVVVGSDRIASNGDVANKIGTYGVAVLAQYHTIPFYVAAPVSTIDFDMKSGKDIPIEERDSEEVRSFYGMQSGPAGVDVYNPAFDVTPARMVDVIITERGVSRPPYPESLAKLRNE
ncbi:MAG: S-methyl-5-thioribose-1-phosphate isomerase [bacterium]|nr:S-methyl-5-thioribose-1-phosphate isomerase [bacterium]